MSDQIIARVSQSLAKEQSLESLVRQLLEMLEMVTDMESTYLTKVDVEARLQHIMFARNSQKMHIPENFTVSWDYSLCKRAIDENCFFSDEVPDRWGDCVAARNLGITTFLSTPIPYRMDHSMARFAPPAVRSASGVNARNRSYSCSPD